MGKTSKAQLVANKKYNATVERINVVVPNGTKERITALGYTYAEFIRDILIDQLDTLERK